MSLILDALRKMEQERKARREPSAELRREVLSYRGAPSAGSDVGRWPLIAGAAGLLLAGLAGWYFFASSQPPAVPTPPSGQAASQVTPATMPPTPVPATITPTAPPVQPAPPATPLPPPKEPVASRQPAAGSNENLAVSGIAWQEERSRRRAVVNGTLVKEGAEVGGARVVEITERGVRFSRGGSSFDIPYPSGDNR